MDGQPHVPSASTATGPHHEDNTVDRAAQVWCKNVEALGGCAASFLGPLLFEAVSPFFPFFVSATFSTDAQM